MNNCEHCGQTPVIEKMPTMHGHVYMAICGSSNAGMTREEAKKAGVCFNRPLTNSKQTEAEAIAAIPEPRPK